MKKALVYILSAVLLTAFMASCSTGLEPVEDLENTGYTIVISGTAADITTTEPLENVKITFYEKLLGKQVADVPDDAAMLEIIWDSVCADVGLTFQDTVGTYSGLVYVVCEISQPNSHYGGLASFLASNENKANVGFKKFIDGIK